MTNREIHYVQLSRTEAEQLLSYVESAEREGCYYGDKRWFDKRHKTIKNQLENIMKIYQLSNNQVPKGQ